MKRLIRVLVVVVFGLFLGMAPPQVDAHGDVPFSTPNVRHLCKGIVTGILRDITSGGCFLGETPLHINITGPAGPPGPAGTPGAAGPPGPTGPAGVSMYEKLFSQTAFNSISPKSFTQGCPSGKRVLSCGARLVGLAGEKELALDEIVSPTGQEFCAAQAHEVVDTVQDWSLGVSAVCAVVQ